MNGSFQQQPAKVSHTERKITMKTSLKIDSKLSPKRDRNNSFLHQKDPIAEHCLVRVLAAMNAIITTAMTGTCYHSRDIGDSKLYDFLSRKDVGASLFLNDMVVANRTSFFVFRVDRWIVLRINMTCQKEKIWFIELEFGLPNGSLEKIVFH